MKLGLGS
jgi:hypothetical protein